MFIDLFMIDLIFESYQVEKIVPFALFFHIVDVIVDQMCIISLEEGQSIPLIVYNAPNMLFFLLHILQ